MHIHIIKGQANKVALTLLERADSEDSEWLVEMKNDSTGRSKVFAVQEISNTIQRQRAVQFNITESSSENLGHGVVSLSPSGQWSYTVYEMSVSSPKNLDPDDAIKIVDTGTASVYDSTEGQSNTFDEDEDIDNPVFDEE